SIDIVFSVIKHVSLSVARLLPASFNFILGDRGVFGPRKPYQDDRHWLTKLVYGAVSSPIWLPIFAITNSIDIVFSVIKHVSLSVARLLPASFNFILGDRGVFGPRKPYQDDRHWLTKLVYGAVSSPIWLPIFAITTSIDIVFSVIKHVSLSVARLLPASFNFILGYRGV